MGCSCEPDPGTANGYADELRFEREPLAIGHTGRFASGTLESSVMHNTTSTEGRTIPGTIGEPYAGFPSIIGGQPRELETHNRVIDSKFIVPLGDHVATFGGQWWDAELDDGLATEAVTRGIELSSRIQLALAWNLGANCSYTDSVQKRGDFKGLFIVPPGLQLRRLRQRHAQRHPL
ncbi:hypothetical protein [Halomonas jincaotanensis]|uniref:hypothetical protein n=1 Tax=Halomonas jincaotanensis TaxID=2810616 RepID=UPI002022C893|nr:hypothetical protein [Halomonas jincaotanensis]